MICCTSQPILDVCVCVLFAKFNEFVTENDGFQVQKNAPFQLQTNFRFHVTLRSTDRNDGRSTMKVGFCFLLEKVDFQLAMWVYRRVNLWGPLLYVPCGSVQLCQGGWMWWRMQTNALQLVSNNFGVSLRDFFMDKNTPEMWKGVFLLEP